MAFHIYLSHFYKLSGLLSNLFLAEISLKPRRILIKSPLQIVRKIVAKDFFLRFSLILAAGLLREFTEMVEFSPRFFRFF